MQAQIKQFEPERTSTINSISHSDLQTRPRQASLGRTTLRPSVIEKEPQILPNVATNQKKSAYQMLKAVTKKREDEEHAKNVTSQLPTQINKSKMPLIQIRPQGIKVASHVQNISVNPGQQYPLPYLAPSLGPKNKIEQVLNEGKEQEGAQTSGSSEIQKSNPRGNLSLGSQPSQEKDLHSPHNPSEISLRGKLYYLIPVFSNDSFKVIRLELNRNYQSLM